MIVKVIVLFFSYFLICVAVMGLVYKLFIIFKNFFFLKMAYIRLAYYSQFLKPIKFFFLIFAIIIFKNHFIRRKKE